MVEVKNEILNQILFEITDLKKEIKSLKKNLYSKDLGTFVDYLKENNELATDEEAKKVGLKL